ncbi:oligosaccharide flippase family protein [Sphingomonas sp.]|uniref:oligosaccharide flippase family protein n=1 Tax=Sphingomonas sp. TaxID=28214 RepID=UPI0031D8017A
MTSTTHSEAVSAAPPEPEVDLRRSAVAGGSYLAARHAMSVVLKMIGVLVITRVLGPTRYGSYVTAFNIYTYALLIGQAGVGVYLLRHAGPVTENIYRTAYTVLLGIALCLCVALQFVSLHIAGWTTVEGSGTVLSVLACALPFTLTTVAATARLERNLDYRSIAQVEVTAQLIFYAVGVPMALAGYGAVALACAWLFQEATSCLLAHYRARVRPHYGFDARVAREMAHYASSFSFANWVWQARMLVNPLIMGPLLGAQAVGIIGMTVGILELLSIAKTVAWRLSVAVLSKVQHDTARLRKAVGEGMELQTLAVGAILLGFGWFGGIAVPIVFGDRWAPVMELYPFVALSYLSIATFNVHSAVISILNRNHVLGVANVVHLSLFAGVAALLAPRMGFYAYGIGELATIPVYFAFHLIIARAIGTPNYRLTMLWWLATAIGLFWHHIGYWAILVPFLALGVPTESRQRLLAYVHMVRRRPGSVTA